MQYGDLCNSSDVVDALRGAICSEWLAYYQYWWASVVVKGGNGSTLSEHFNRHAEEEN